MLNCYDQRVIIMAAGLWFIAFIGTSLAGETQAKPKALAHYIMATVNDLNGDEQQALQEYEKSAKFDPRQSMPHLKLGAYYLRLNRIKDAIAQLKTVIKLQPDSSQGHYLLALIYSSQKKYDLAAGQYESVLKTTEKNNLDHSDVHAYLAQLYFAMRKYSQAGYQISEVLQFQPKNVSALFLEGNVYVELNQREKAKEDFRKILGLEPEHEGALNSLAYMYAEEGINLDEALKMARKAIDLEPSSGVYYDTLGWILFKRGFYEESLMALEKAQGYVSDPIVYEHIGDVYLAANQPTLARKFWLQSLALDPAQVKISAKLQELNKESARNQNLKNNLTK